MKKLRVSVILVVLSLLFSACYGSVEKSVDATLTAIASEEEATPEPKGVTKEEVEEIVDAAFVALQTPIPNSDDSPSPAEETDSPAEESTGDKIITEWFTANVPAEVTTIKTNTTGGCNMPSEVCYVVDDAGVLGADNLEEANANESAVWTASAVYHDSPDGPEYGFLIPEGSYGTTYAKQFGKVAFGPADEPLFTLSIPSCGKYCAQGILVRGLFHEDHEDRHVPMLVGDYGAIGGASWTRYAVPYEAAQFFSQDYLTAQADNALVFDNNGIGPKDTDVFIQHIIDLNDGSYTVLRYLENKEWEVLWTNIVGHGRD